MDQEKTQKLTGIDSILSTLNRGSVGDQVKALQQYLNGLGYDVGKIDSIYGPKTEMAVKQFQLDNGLQSDGSFGPLSLGKAKTLGSTNMSAGAPGTGKNPDDPSFMFNTQTGELNPNFVPKTQEELDTYYRTAALSHPTFQGNTPEALSLAAETGDFSALSDANGKPFNLDAYNEEVAKATEAFTPGFEAEASKDRADFESNLDQNRLNYERSLETDKANFETEKENLDQEAANSGVLFSGGRYERERKLADAYKSKGDYTRDTMGRSMGNTIRDFQYSYGNEAVDKPSLSQYYKLGGNTYNANTARGGVGSSSLSSIYNPSKFNFQGTVPVSNKAAVTTDAMRRLANRGNKLLSTGYQNTF